MFAFCPDYLLGVAAARGLVLLGDMNDRTIGNHHGVQRGVTGTCALFVFSIAARQCGKLVGTVNRGRMPFKCFTDISRTII
jgi:hypothetical protein